MSGYLGYDRCALGILLGALEAVRDERLPAGPWYDSVAGRQAALAVELHRRVTSGLAGFAERVAAVLRADTLGPYRPVVLDAGDLGLWAVHRGGRWSTVTDRGDTSQRSRQELEVVNARLVACQLTGEHVRTVLRGGGEDSGLTSLHRYLTALRSSPAARAAFLAALGPDRFGTIVRVASSAVMAHHLPVGEEDPAAAVTRRPAP